MKGDILCSNTMRSVWLQNYNHALSRAFIQTKNKQNSFRGRREAIFCCTIPFQFHCQNNSKVQQSSQRAASQVLDNKKALFQNHIFKNVTPSENNNSLKVFLDEFCYNIIQFVKIARESKTDNENNNANIWKPHLKNIVFFRISPYIIWELI